jgi:endonuclease/exonuclease/phosphatase family metal-dependent hydrolase
MFRVLVTILGALAVGVAIVGLVARYVPIRNNGLVVVAAASPYLMGAGPVGVILLGLGRQWVPTALAVCLCVVMVGIQVPRYLGPETSGLTTAAVRVMSANLLYGRADPPAVVALARDSADVLVVQELTPQAASGLSAAGLDDTFPHRVIDPRDGWAGIGIWSRYPIGESGSISGYDMPVLTARIRVPEVVTEPTVVAVHLAAPWVQPIELWQQDMARLQSTLHESARDAGAGAVIVAGDMNATFDMMPFRRLLSDGYRDAAEQAGAGLTLSYPNRPRLPPMLGIDHVLVYNCVATSARTVVVRQSDHRGLLVTVDVPLDPTAS